MCPPRDGEKNEIKALLTPLIKLKKKEIWFNVVKDNTKLDAVKEKEAHNNSTHQSRIFKSRSAIKLQQAVSLNFLQTTSFHSTTKNIYTSH